MAGMTMKGKRRKPKISPAEIDDLVAKQANDDWAWGKAVRVKRGKLASLSIPADLAARAAFLAQVHRERRVDEWLARIIRERVELEEVAFVEARRHLGPRR